ncbi:DEAD/DEAH box helicase [Luteococcus sp. Sow4_B9]|uniref:DEAD/DEAH box helicase n=1 Tax=Luteococcus sp. Sow4_B9 TaxID=3438792 RepID=UPI003F9880CA
MPRPTPHGRKAAKTPGFKPAKKGPKNFKADGTPKNRWSADKRAALGHAPRSKWENRDDRAPRGEREERGYRSNEREDRGFRGDRPERGYRGDRQERGYRSNDREERGFRPERREDFRSNAPRTADSKGRNFERFDPRSVEPRAEDRGDRREGGFGGRAPRQMDRGQFDGGSRGGRQDRFERGDRRDFSRGDRREGDRFERGDRREGDRFERGPRKDYRPARKFDSAPRPKWEPRVDRQPWERPERPQRDERPARGHGKDDRMPADERTWRDERPARNERSSFTRDDRPSRGEHRSFDRRENRSFDRREDRPANENLDQMSWEATDLGEVDDSAVVETEGFAALGVPKKLVAALDKQGITSPFPIQTATIPDAIAGRDVLGRGQTGSGKTLGFGLPMLTRISQAESTGGAPRGLVLVPTRELALQCADVLAPLAKTLRLDLTLIAGGMGYGPQLRAFDRGVDIVVATPGRLIDLLEQGAVDLSQVLVTVLDEADHMADLGFMPAVTTLMDTVPADGQRLLFSATLDGAVDKIVKKYLHDPITHEVDSDRASVTTMEHVLLHVPPHEKNAITAEIANREGRSVIFCRTQMGTNRVAEQLRAAGVMAGALHGGLTQGARTRILAAFKEGTVPVLVATDVAARGIHVDDVTLVLEVDPPMNHKDYLHRAGRTARAGTKGVVASICLPHQRRSMLRLLGAAGVKAEQLSTHPGEEALAEKTGARPVTAAPIEDAEYERIIAPKRGGGRGPRQGGGRGGFGGGRGGYRGQGGGGRRFGGDRDRGGRGGNGEGWRRDR